MVANVPAKSYTVFEVLGEPKSTLLALGFKAAQGGKKSGRKVERMYRCAGCMKPPKIELIHSGLACVAYPKSTCEKSQHVTSEPRLLSCRRYSFVNAFTKPNVRFDVPGVNKTLKVVGVFNTEDIDV